MINIKESTLLIVDDVPENLGLLFSYLREIGFNVNIAESGEDALEQIGYAKPDLILLDVMMPGINGFETCRRLKENEETHNIPVIFMTALSDTVDKVKGFQMGAVDYLTKPIQHEEVLARITAHLTLRHQQQMLEQQNRELESFAHTVAHDLKNPLGGIYSMSQLVIQNLDCWPQDKVLKSLEAIELTSTKTLDIINSLLLLASVRQQDVPMNPLNMAEIITQVQQQIEFIIKKYQGEIIISTTWPTVQGYAPWIEHIWTNYIINGLKYGGKPPRLELGATSEENGTIRFWVRDNGHGLTFEEQKSLFVPFSRISQARIDGHGLGLSIVQRIIERCGGEVGL
ncbi:hybrid sensor histidine kinase/response regulator, partial [Candidatus Marithioploca araucensis]|nr:hybrid sensor histidine kinase/response regulator [Candidatus Marithioploca araucensis]